ncbi:unnamed protein product [marine sediment metagenome]|uniref:Uncharacterized protein n=1 Tax=marine sediment metagenome TaxID=412755 RepID=X0S4E1_9ZZZZ
MGRPAGAKNKMTATVKENIVAVFNKLEGTAGMAKWAQKNPDSFYRMYGQLAPKEIVADVVGDLTINLVSQGGDQPTDTDT